MVLKLEIDQSIKKLIFVHLKDNSCLPNNIDFIDTWTRALCGPFDIPSAMKY